MKADVCLVENMPYGLMSNASLLSTSDCVLRQRIAGYALVCLCRHGFLPPIRSFRFMDRLINQRPSSSRFLQVSAIFLVD